VANIIESDPSLAPTAARVCGPQLVALLSSPNGNIRDQSVAALLAIAAEDGGAEALCTLPCVPALLQVLRRGPSCPADCISLLRLVLRASPPHAPLALRLGAVEQLAALAGDPDCREDVVDVMAILHAGMRAAPSPVWQAIDAACTERERVRLLWLS
jgi:hypothetical protein